MQLMHYIYFLFLVVILLSRRTTFFFRTSADRLWYHTKSICQYSTVYRSKTRIIIASVLPSMTNFFLFAVWWHSCENEKFTVQYSAVEVPLWENLVGLSKSSNGKEVL